MRDVAYGAGTFITVGVNGTILQSDSVLPPSLQLSKSGTNLVFSWPAAAGNLAVEETAESLTSPTWSQSADQVPTTVGGQTIVTLPGSEQSETRFYRLVKQP